MSKITYVQPDGSLETCDVSPGKSLMLAAQSKGISGILGECGGQAMCATCHVYVDESFLDKLPAPSEEEDAMLEEAASDRRPNSRLSCQIDASDELDGLVVHVPAEQLW
ncbi:2Fe-2S iron-sulfur cluster-binding protein [Rhodococcus globerulus]|uniref:2Fe-2S iron-sulfur cluster-binding protein n=1 Tax=Rhodococcus globerulus TaxID=33008 RepID=A0ABU4C4P0_RHOGO|nr:2Fe-2S iron-sulfur cluster-binding protein [Rhodococcus globerulus]MDV6271457.1 2Fe-2S iron-sulfur cluster-binding protein [Rhodococcus globerulus]